MMIAGSSHGARAISTVPDARMAWNIGSAAA